jgi:hypothetical protein
VDGAPGVVLVGPGYAEESEQPVPETFVYGPVETVDHLAARFLVLEEQLPQRLFAYLLGNRGRGDQIANQDGGTTKCVALG